MKILVISLLRLGDLVMHRSLLRGIKEKYPQAEVHLLINDSSVLISNLISEADRIHLFQRKKYFQQINDSSSHLLKPYFQLNDEVNSLNLNEFDVLYNFTHNRLSAFLAAAIKAKKKFGLIAENYGFRPLANPWMKYFNDRFSDRFQTSFNYIELLGKSLDITPVWPKSINTMNRKLVLISCITSDEKKNWPLNQYRELFLSLKHHFHEYDFKIVCAEFEKPILLDYFSSQNIIAADFTKLDEILKRTLLIICPDSVIKHLAAENGLPIIEVIVGSSDLRRTPALTSDSVFCVPTTNCCPCTHGNTCQVNFQCHNDLEHKNVFSTFKKYLQKINETNRQDLSFDGLLFSRLAEADRIVFEVNKLFFDQLISENKSAKKSISTYFKTHQYTDESFSVYKEVDRILLNQLEQLKKEYEEIVSIIKIYNMNGLSFLDLKKEIGAVFFRSKMSQEFLFEIYDSLNSGNQVDQAMREVNHALKTVKASIENFNKFIKLFYSHRSVYGRANQEKAFEFSV